jgi:hypothetical protein
MSLGKLITVIALVGIVAFVWREYEARRRRVRDLDKDDDLKENDTGTPGDAVVTREEEMALRTRVTADLTSMAKSMFTAQLKDAAREAAPNSQILREQMTGLHEYTGRQVQETVERLAVPDLAKSNYDKIMNKMGETVEMKVQATVSEFLHDLAEAKQLLFNKLERVALEQYNTLAVQRGRASVVQIKGYMSNFTDTTISGTVTRLAAENPDALLRGSADGTAASHVKQLIVAHYKRDEDSIAAFVVSDEDAVVHVAMTADAGKEIVRLRM